MEISNIKAYPVIVCIVQEKDTNELDKQVIPFFKNDIAEFYKKYPQLENVKKPNGEVAKPFSAHHFPYLTIEMCRELREFVDRNRHKILSTKQGILHKIQEMYDILTDDLLSMEAMDTTIIPQLDVDDGEILSHPFFQDLMSKNPPYFDSVRKKLPKICVKIKNMPPNHQNRITHNNSNGESQFEILCGQISFRDRTTPFHNINNPIPEIDYNEMVRLFPDMVSSTTFGRLEENMDRNEETESTTTTTSTTTTRTTETFHDCVDLPPSTQIVDFVLEHLDPSRCNDYKKWFAVLCAIYNCFDDKEVACQKAQEWSKKSAKYNEKNWSRYGKDRQMFMRLYNSRNAFHTLRFYLKQDNYEIYKRIFPPKTSIEKNVYVSRHEKNMIYKFSEKTVADMFASLPISKNYVFCEEFYEFDGILYRKENSLSHRIYEMIEPILSNHLFDLEKDDKDDKKIYKDLQKYIKDIGKTSFLNGVKKQLRYFLEDKEFKNKLDTNLNLLAFNDCVFDLTIKEFRPTTPNDYISRSVGYNRPVSNAVIRKELETFLRNIFPDKDVYNYMRALNASCLFRGNVNNLFPIWTGRGSNGKSSFMGLKQKALGEYSLTLPISVLTTVMKNHATSDLPLTRGCRHVRFDEPTTKIRILGNVIKVLTGGDPITCRGLYKESITMVMTGVCELLSNAMPLMDCYDYAIGRRLSPIPFTKQFLNAHTKLPYDENNPNHRLRDEKLREKLEMPLYYQEYMLMMLEDYLEFFSENEILPKVPPSIQSCAIEYEEDNNDTQDISGWFHSTYRFLSQEEYDKNKEEAKKKYGKNIKSLWTEYRRDTKDTTIDEREFQLAFRELEGFEKVIKHKKSVMYYMLKYKHEDEVLENSYVQVFSTTNTVPL